MSSNPSAVHPETLVDTMKPYTPLETKHPAKWQKKVAKFMDQGNFQAFLMALLMLSLFLADSWVLGNSPDSTNDALYGLLTAIFVIFMMETIALSFVQDKYFLSFYFFMDLIGNLSIILDIGWVSNSFLPSGAGRSRGSILRATRAAKLGARYGRLMRLLKLMRLFRFLPCFAKEDESQEPEPTMSAVRKVSRELISLLSLRIAALTMMLVIVVPFLAYVPVDAGPNAFLSQLSYLIRTNSSMDLIDHSVGKFRNFYDTHDAKLLYVELESPYFAKKEFVFHHRKVLRESNILIFTRSFVENDVKYQLTANMDQTIPNELSSAYGISLMVLVIWILVGFSASFTTAVENLVVAPLNKMMTILRESASMMLRSMKAMEEADESKGEGKRGDDNDSDADDELETALLEKMVEKLARIMKHVLPGAQEMNINANVDTATASWLTSNFSQGAASHVVEAMEVDEDAERIRLLELSATQTVVSNEKLNSWYFDTLDYSHDQLNEILCYVFSIFNFFEEFKVPMPVFKEFLTEISGRYIENTYHNYKHGVDVCHTVYRLLMVPQLNQAMTTLELFSILIAALSHDVGHPGLNNLYLVKSRNDLALRHNDRSPLENMHCAVLYEIVTKEKSNIFINFSDQHWRDSRKIILTSILGTDMSHHFEQISKTQVFLEVNGDDTKKFCRGEKDTIDCFREDNNRLFILELLLHCADISNPYKPFEICYKWCILVVEEFSLQGDREKEEKLEVSPMCDRNAIILTNMQMGFIEFVVTPLISALINVFPPLYEIGQHMCGNYMNWGERRKIELNDDDKLTPEAKVEEIRKLSERMGKYKDRMSFLDAYQEAPRRQSGHPDTLDDAAAQQTAPTLVGGPVVPASPVANSAPRPVRRASIKAIPA